MFLLKRVFVFINCIYSTIKLVKGCTHVCCVQTKISYLLIYLLTTACNDSKNGERTI